MATFRGRQAATAFLLVFAFVTIARGPARADTSHIETGPSPVLSIQLGTGALTVRTWDQSQILINADPGVQSRHLSAQEFAQRIPAQIFFWSQNVRTPDGTVLKLEPETFLLPNLGAAPHDAVFVRGSGNATIDVPNGTALVIANVKRGDVAITGYKNGVFVAHIGGGSMQLDNVSGTGAIQVNNGEVIARNSDFARLRVRTVRGNMQFENCNATQIEATSLMGSILYDNGNFQPGLARFESERGNVMLGVAGSGVQIGAHSSVGQIYSDSSAVQAGQTDAQATLGRGGPVVTATSGTGSVIFYNGALRNHPALARRFGQRVRRLQQKPPQDGHVHLKRMLR